MIKLSLTYSFRKVIFIFQNLKYFFMTYSVLELLIFFLSTLDIQLHLFLILMSKNPVSLCGVKIANQQFLIFLSFMNIFRSSGLQMFFKIRALKNFAIFWIKNSLHHRYFPVNMAKFFRKAFLQNFSRGCFYIILKVIKQLHRKGYF